LFAEDINTLVFDKNKDAFQHKILYIMKELEIWFQKNYPIMNIEKRVAIIFHSDEFILPSKPPVVFNDNEIVFKPEVRFFKYLHYRKFKMEYPCLFTMFKFD
jgi:hypothetical protein